MYLTREDLESLVHWLASELFAEYDSPMPAFTLMGEQGSALLDSALALPRQSAFGKNAYPSVFDKAAVLFRSLIRNHPLLDGNKRLATAATIIFLLVNGWLLIAERDELVRKALDMASPQGMSWKSVARWLKAHACSWRDPRFDRILLSRFEAQLRAAAIEGRLSQAELSEAMMFLEALTNDVAKGAREAGAASRLVEFFGLFETGIAEGKVPEGFVSVLRSALVSAAKELLP